MGWEVDGGIAVCRWYVQFCRHMWPQQHVLVLKVWFKRDLRKREGVVWVGRWMVLQRYVNGMCDCCRHDWL